MAQQLDDERTRPLLERQMGPADLVIISKSELVTADERDVSAASIISATVRLTADESRRKHA